VTAAVVALAADRISRPGGPTPPRVPGGLAASAFVVAPQGTPQPIVRREATLRRDPFDPSGAAPSGNSVAPTRNGSTVSGGAASRQLTAILVANNRPIAVINDEVVGVGDVLRDGARVSRIQSERVFLVEKNGQWRTLTLAAGRP
jgi:hypothetical protein